MLSSHNVISDNKDWTFGEESDRYISLKVPTHDKLSENSRNTEFVQVSVAQLRTPEDFAVDQENTTPIMINKKN